MVVVVVGVVVVVVAVVVVVVVVGGVCLGAANDVDGDDVSALLRTTSITLSNNDNNS